MSWIMPSVIFLGLVLAMGFAAVAARRMRVRRAERLARARPARAVVLAHAARGIRVRGPWSALELELEVHPPEGHKYVAKTCWAVLDDQAPALAPGQPVAVKVDREDPQVVFPDVHDARYSWSGATQMRNRPVPG